MADEDQKDLTADTQAEALDKSTDTEAEQSVDTPGESVNPAADEQGNDTEGEADSQPGEREGEGETPTKKDNRSGWQVRQLANNNPAVQRIRERLQPWVEASEDAYEQKDRQRDVNDYIRDAVKAQDDIQRDAEQATSEIDIFNPQSPQFNQVLFTRAMNQYARDMCETDQNGAVDQNGNPIIVGYRMRLIDFLREKAEDYGFSGSLKAGSGKQSQSKKAQSNKAKAKMDAAADTPSGASAATGKGKEDKDPFLAGFDDPYGRHAPANAHTWSER